MTIWRELIRKVVMVIRSTGGVADHRLTAANSLPPAKFKADMR